MKFGWDAPKLEAVATFSNGLWKGKKGPLRTANVLRNTNFRPNGVLSFDDVAELEVETRQFEKRQLTKGDIILERSGGGPKQPVGRVALFDISDTGYSYSNFTSAIRLKPDSRIDPKYLHHLLNWWYLDGRTEQIQSNSTSIRNLDFNAYKAFSVMRPPLEEQQRIVAILDEAFEGLDRARANAEANLQNARELFESYLETEFAAVDHSIETPLGEHIDLLAGYAFKSAGYIEDPKAMRLMRGDNIVPGAVRWEGAKYWPVRDCEPYKKFQLMADDVLIAMDRTWIKAGIKFAVLSDDDVPSLLVQRVARLRCLASLDTRFLAMLIGSKSFERYVLSIQTGTGVPHISPTQIREFKFPIPDIETQAQIVERLTSVRDDSQKLSETYTQKLQDLADLRQSLLQKAFAGQLT